MLGWHISIYRQGGSGSSPATAETSKGARLAVWQTGYNGLVWLNDLVKAGKAVNLGGSGYPCLYTAAVETILPLIVDAPPGARQAWTHEINDIVLEKWEGKTVIDRAAIKDCQADEWLIIEAWDES